MQIFGNEKADLGYARSGVFARWAWDGRCLSAENDRYGYYPLYYFCTGDKIGLSPSITSLLEHLEDIKLDDDAFSVFLRLGTLVGNDTLFSDIKAVPPNSKLRWQDGELEIITEKLEPVKPSSLSRASAMDAYIELFTQAMTRTLPVEGDIGLPLSGGRDSRHILLELCKLGRPPAICLTSQIPPIYASEDIKAAAALCEKLNIPHAPILPDRPRFELEREKNDLTGFSVAEHAWYVPISRRIREEYDISYDGIAGDVLSAGHFLDAELFELFRTEDCEKIADTMLGGEGYLPKLLTNKEYKKLDRERAIARLAKEIPPALEEPNPVGAYYLKNRTRRGVIISSYRLIGDEVKIITPFLEYELYDFLASLTSEFLLDHNFHTQTIARAYPEFSSIPYGDKSVKETPQPAVHTQFARDLFRYSLTSRKKALIDRKFLLTRTLRGIVDGSYGSAVAHYGELATILLQLERI